MQRWRSSQRLCLRSSSSPRWSTNHHHHVSLAVLAAGPTTRTEGRSGLFQQAARWTVGSRAFSTPAAEPNTEMAKPWTELPSFGFPEFLASGAGEGRVLDAHIALRKSYGDIVRFNTPGNEMLFLFDPQDIQYVMQREGKWPVGGASFVWPLTQAFEKRGESNVGFAQGETWKRLRTALQKDMFPPLEADTYMPLVSPVVEECRKLLPQHGADLDKFLPTVTLEMIAAVLFGRSLGTFTGNAPKEDYEYIDNVLQLFNVADEMLMKHPSQVPEEEKEKITKLVTSILDRGEYHVNLTLKSFEQGKLSRDTPPYILRVMQQKDLSHREVIGNVAGLLLAGVDTTANTLQWFLYNLARNPDVQERLHQEVSSVLKGRPLLKEDLAELPFLKGCLKETFRLTPTTAGTVRILSESITLKGHSIPPGIPFMLSPIPVSLDPEVFDKPSEFIPDRYDRKAKGERVKSNPLHDSPYVHMPFSRGPRMCMGARLAELEIYAFMARFVQDYKIKLATNSPAKVLAISRLTIRPMPSPTYDITPRRSL